MKNLFLAMLVVTAPSALACKRTALGASAAVLAAVTDHVVQNSDNHSLEISRVDMEYGTVRVELRAGSSCQVHRYEAVHESNCDIRVAEVINKRAEVCRP